MTNTRTLLDTFKDDETLFTIVLTDEVIENDDAVIISCLDDETKLDFDSDDELIDVLTDSDFTFTFVHERLRHLLAN